MARISTGRRQEAFGSPATARVVQVTTPWGITVPCHIEIAGLFLEACAEVSTLDIFAVGSVLTGAHPLPVGRADLHPVGLAWDFLREPPGYPVPGGVCAPHYALPEEFAECFTKRGFSWGGNWTVGECLAHIEWAGPKP